MSGAAPELERLKATLAAFGGPSGIEEAAEALRAQRRELAEGLLALDSGQAAAQFAGETAESHRLLVGSGLRDLPRDEQDQELAHRIRRALDARPAASGPLLAAMLLFQGFELPPPDSLERLPDWLLPDYVRFLLSMPRIFHGIGDAGRYGQFAAATVDCIHAYVLTHDSALAGAVRDIFIAECRLLQVYFNEDSLKGLYRKRAEILEHAALWAGASLAHTFLPRRATAQPRRLRVGVLMQHLGPQTETYFMLAHFERFPRERCILILYALQDEPRTELSDYARSLADGTVDLPHHPNEAAARIRADDLDILLVGSNITVAASALTFLSLFRLARTQVISGSSPVTTGLTCADWFLNAEENESEVRAAEHYTEQVYRMPGMLNRYAYYLDKAPQTLKMDRADLGVPRNAILFMSGANFFKVVPEFSAVLARIMARVPGAWLLLMPFNQNWSTSYFSDPLTERVLRDVAQAGGDPDRVLVMQAVPTRADLHGIMSLADVYLDSFPFPGACSLLDPLLVGTPLVARTGPTFRGDVGAAMLRGIGLGDMAVHSAEAYVERAISLARDAGLRKHARTRILTALSPRNPVFDSDTGSRNMEAAFWDLAAQSEAADAALEAKRPQALRAAIERLAGSLALERNPWFGTLTDLELGRQILLPYFQSLPKQERRRHMIDVGACVGQVSVPFLASEWSADLFEPDAACEPHLQALERHFGERVRVHRMAVSDSAGPALSYYRSATGLSGLSPSPFGATEATVQVAATRLDRFCRDHDVNAIDLLKVDAEGWDFDVLYSHDFENLPPRLVMVEFGTEFDRQPLDEIRSAITWMKARGYDALVFSYEDDGNFKRQVWKYRLIAATFGTPVSRKDGHVGGNIVFFRDNDHHFLALILRVFLGFKPPRERQAFFPD